MGLSTLRSFDDWYAQAWSSLYRAVAASLGSGDLAEEATAEACTRALERWSRVGAMASPTGWAFRVAINHGRRLRRRRKVERALFLGRARPVDASADEDMAGFLRSLDELTQRERQVVALRYALGFSDREIATALDIAESTVSATRSRALRRLRIAVLEPSTQQEGPS